MKKKRIIIISVTMFLLFLFIIFGIIIKNNFVKKNETNNLNDRIKFLLNGAYDYYYFTNGDVKTTEASISENDVKYNFVDSDKYESIDDLTNLVESIFVSEFVSKYIEKINSNHKYLQIDNKLYINKSDDICLMENNIDYNSIKIKDVDEDTKLLEWNDTFTYIYLVDNEWYLSAEVFYCVDDNELSNLEEE